jgi:hypothetical protein
VEYPDTPATPAGAPTEAAPGPTTKRAAGFSIPDVKGQPARSIDFGVGRIARTVGHFATWAGYRLAGGPEPAHPPARLTYHSS